MIITISTDKEILFKAELIDPKPEFLVDYANKLRGSDDTYMLSVEFILRRYGLKLEQVRSKSRKAPLPEIRKIIIYRLIYRHGFTHTKAAGFVNCNHTMASSAINLIHNGWLREIYKEIFPSGLDFKKEE